MESSRVTVKAGDTASKISELKKPANVSLDQMLVALLRANPTAFVGNNVNRIKAGSVLDMPTTEQAESTPAAEATQIIVAQSKDFNDFRRKLAGNAPSTQIATADRKVSGSVQAQVEEKKTGLPTPDKLTLSKGAIKGQAAEDQLAKERSAKEAASRAAEIAKNIAELSKLGAASNAATPALAASAATPEKSNSVAITAAVAAPAPAASEPVMASSVPVLPASTAVSAPAPAASAVAKKPKPISVPVPEPEPGFVDELLANPLLPAGAGGLFALLAGFGYYRFKQRKNASKAEHASLESRLQADSFYADMGGQLVDTADQTAASASMVYSSSQLDAVDDVDPVAEADVYLAYGRDLQAEEILKDALRTHPGRVAVHQKLLEIFAKRNDTKNFEDTARQAFALTTGNGQDWDRICELGLSIDPTNTLYQPGGQPSEPNGQPSGSAPLEFTSSSVGALDNTPEDAPEAPALETTDLDLDLDLDFSLDDETSSAIPEAIAPPTEVEPSPLDLDFELTPETLPDAEPVAESEPEPAKDTSHDIEFTLPDLDFELAGDRAEPDTVAPTLDLDDFKLQDEASSTESPPLDLVAEDAETETQSPPPQDLSMLDFDLGSLSLELEETPAADSSAAEAAHEDPLGTKLALAEEFLAIGDDDGARALIEEVIAEATGDMKLKAQRALSNL
jgi:pilus assembly protein FimV